MELGLSMWKSQRDIGGALAVPVISREVQRGFNSIGCRATGLRFGLGPDSDSGFNLFIYFPLTDMYILTTRVGISNK